ncbi:MAG: DegT/DnrJ/EryC1/StrS aminotransferase family protein [Christensenellaceae bacterium]|jgi:putative capsular polysaccharide biosynthesis protein|nr:DegT/DnrJ/EryC1/StrS aminotransferase family protein [Christensenellaceae bacterium]MBS6563802.1 DegT/DnrJ/EryC1/StrS aminotransferase family protein [Clostridiales bacterium]PWL96872.1 MAG: capsular biosynthesis protein [Selenomonadales bacterium]
MNIPFSPPDINQEDIDEVVNALRSGWITTGPRTKEFEKQIARFCGAQRAVCLNSATAGLELTLRLLGIGEGDEVITTAYTYTASASVICHVGAKPVIIDTAPGSFFMAPEQLEGAINSRTKAVIPVDLAGIPVNYEQLYSLLEGHNSVFQPANKLQEALGRIAILADAAHSFGASRGGIMSGSLADFTSFSFHAVKNLTTAEGGAVTWKNIPGVEDEEIYKNYMLLSLHGQTKDALNKNSRGGWEYDILLPGYKCNMTDMAAALGLSQLKRYESILSRRAQLIAFYDAAFAGSRITPIKHFDNDYKSSGHLYITRIEGVGEQERNQLIDRLAQNGVAANVHYKPLPMLTAYKNLGFDIKDYPNAYNMYKNEITLPLNTVLTDEQAEYTAKLLLSLV